MSAPLPVACAPVPAGPVAQWLEPAAHNGLVAGSSPAGPTTFAGCVRTTKERFDRRPRATRFLPLRTTRFPHPPELIETIRSNSAYSNSKRCKNRRGSFLHFAAAASRRISHKNPYANRPVILPGVFVCVFQLNLRQVQLNLRLP